MKSRPSGLTQAHSRPRDIIECLVDDTLVQTRQDHAAIRHRWSAAVHILIENVYKFKYFGVKKLILEFSDKS